MIGPYAIAPCRNCAGVRRSDDVDRPRRAWPRNFAKLSGATRGMQELEEALEPTSDRWDEGMTWRAGPASEARPGGTRRRRTGPSNDTGGPTVRVIAGERDVAG